MIVKLAGQAGAFVRGARSVVNRVMLSGVKGVAGAAFIVYGVGQVYAPAAAITAGAFLLLADWKDARGGR